MRKLFNQIHLWLSIPFGVIITIICFSGAVLVYENEIMELVRKPILFVDQVGDETIDAQILVETVEKTLAEDVKVTGLAVTNDPQRAYQVNISQPRRASVAINQYTGEILGRNEKAPFFTFMMRLHRWLLGSREPKVEGGIAWGRMIVGVSTLMFVFVVISGIVIWWPRTLRALKNRISIVTSKGLKRFWYDLHVSAGFWTAMLLLVLALTGLTWSFEWYRTGFYKVLGAEIVQQSSAHQNEQHGQSERKGRSDGDGRPQRSKYASWQRQINMLETMNPDYYKITVSERGATVSHGGWGNQRGVDSYKFNPRTGEVSDIVLYDELDRASKIRGWIYTVHVGSWGGWFSKLLTVIAAIIGASLPITGYYLWIKRLCRKSNSVKS